MSDEPEDFRSPPNVPKTETPKTPTPPADDVAPPKRKPKKT